MIIFAITLYTDGSFIGAIGLHYDTGAGQAELGYWVGKPYWNQGYATEGIKAVVHRGLIDLKLDRVYTAHFARNPASGRVMQKAGMLHGGFLDGHREKWGVFEDLELYGVTREQFGRGGSTGSP